MRRPSSWPVASSTTIRATSSDALVRLATMAGRIISRAKNTGPKTVANRNHCVRTRSRYSRAVMTQSLSMAAHPVLDAARAHTVEGDPVRGGAYELEPFDRRARPHHALEETLRRCVRREP